MSIIKNFKDFVNESSDQSDLSESVNSPRSKLHRIVKGILVAARSTAHDAKEREEKLEKELDDLMDEHPEFTPEMVEKIQDDIAKNL